VVAKAAKGVPLAVFWCQWQLFVFVNSDRLSHFSATPVTDQIRDDHYEIQLRITQNGLFDTDEFLNVLSTLP
jgi:hypothetical protein